MRKLILATMAAVVAACGIMPAKVEPPRVNIVPIMRRNIEVFAEAAGNIEAVEVTEVKSKASGQVISLRVQTGDRVRAGDTLVQLDTREVDNQVDQAVFDTVIAYTTWQNDLKARVRDDSLLNARAITKIAHEAGALTVARSEHNLNKSRTALDGAKQRQADATVLAPISGTIITRNIADGAMVTSSTSGTSAGTTLLTMSDLTQLRVKASFNEIDIANIDTGMVATISVDALPDEAIPGRITKIEPVAVNQQSVTMFPTIITIDNADGRLRPGMNGSVSVWIERRENVVSVPNEALRLTTEVPFLAAVITSITGIHTDADSLKAVVDSQVARLGRTTFSTNPDNSPNGGGGGDIDMSIAEFQQQRGGGARGGGARGGGRGAAQPGRGRAGVPTAEQCAPVKAALAKVAANQKEYDGFIAQLRTPEVDRMKVSASLRALYTKAGVADTALARRCQTLDLGFGAAGGTAMGGGRGGGRGGAGQATQQGRGAQVRARPGLVFVVPSEGVYEARVVQLGLGSYEYTEVLEGLREGENVAILSAAIIAVQQQQNRDRMKGNTSIGGALGGSPAPRGNMGGGRGRGG